MIKIKRVYDKPNKEDGERILVASFLLGVLLELFGVIEKVLVTVLGPSETYGQRGSAFESIVTLGDLAAPLILGISLDILGFRNVSLTIAGFALFLSFVYLITRIKMPKQIKNISN